MPTKTKGYYAVYYPEHKVKQYKYLISHDDYLNDIKPKDAEVMQLNIELSNVNLKKHRDRADAIKKQIAEIKAYIKNAYGSEWFTDNSPIYHSDASGEPMDLGPWTDCVIHAQLTYMHE